MELICSSAKKNGVFTQYSCNDLGAPNLKEPLGNIGSNLQEAIYFCMEHDFDELHVLDLDTVYAIKKYKIRINIGGRAI